MMSANTRRVSVHISETLDHAHREDIAVRLKYQPGIELALLDPDDPHGLMVEYEPEHFSEETLLDFISLHRVHPKIASS